MSFTLTTDVELEFDSSQLSSFMASILKDVSRRYKKALISVLYSDFIPDYLAVFDKYYDSLLGSLRAFEDDDKTSPKYIKPAVMKHVQDSLLDAVGKLNENNVLLRLRAIPTDVWSREPKGDDKNLLHIFYFYTVGIPGEFVFIQKEEYDALNIGDDVYLGRFGNGFLMAMDRYKALYDRAQVKGKNIGVLRTPGQALSPLSGLPPVRIFETVNREIMSTFKKYLDKAKVV